MRHAFNDELVRSVSSVHGTVSDLDLRINELVGATAGIGHAVDRAAISIDSVGSSAEKAVDLLGARVTDTIAGTAREFQRTFEGAGTEFREAIESWSAASGTRLPDLQHLETAALLEQTRETLDRLPTALANALADLPSRELTGREVIDSERVSTCGSRPTPCRPRRRFRGGQTTSPSQRAGGQHRHSPQRRQGKEAYRPRRWEDNGQASTEQTAAGQP